jgi:plasmid stabilization system protein ParE
LQAAYDYWSHEHSAAAADKMRDRIFSAVELMQRYPEMGRTGRVSGTRELVLKPLPFLLAYRVHSAHIDIIALLHGARKWPGKF